MNSIYSPEAPAGVLGKPIISRDKPLTRSRMLQGALAYGECGDRVFPLGPDKRPVIRKCRDAKGLSGDRLAEHARTCSRGGHGFHDATTDRSRITGFWNAYPDASIGVPTGERFWVLDVDVDPEKGLDGRQALAELGLELPETMTVRTPRGGFHLYFQAIEGVTNSRGALPEGIDVRGLGGYVLVPPSPGYEVMNRTPIAEAPPQLLEMILAKPKPERGCGDPTRSAGPVDADPDGAPIPEGQRNSTIFRVGCSYRGRGYEDTELLAALQEINDRRCSPPLQDREILTIWRSVCRYPVERSDRPAKSPEAVAMLERIDHMIWLRDWPGMGGKSERDMLIALLLVARKFGRLVAGGMRVVISRRALSLAAALSRRGTDNTIKRLRVKSLIRLDNEGRGQEEAGAFILVDPTPANKVGQVPTGSIESTKMVERGGLPSLQTPYSAPRLRHSAPRFDRIGDEIVRSVERRLGKTCGAIIDALERRGGSATVADLMADLGAKTRWYFRGTNLARLQEAGVVGITRDLVALADHWIDHLNDERERSGEIAAQRRDMARHEREREAYRTHRERKTDRAPTQREMDSRRASAPASRREAIEQGLVRLFREKPEFWNRRVGQITCELILHYIGPDFPRGVDPGGPPTDAEVLDILDANGAEVAV